MPAHDPSGAHRAAADREALPAGTRLGDFEIVRTVGSGGFGKVYLALDHALDREVAIKEYLPGQLACRMPDGRVAVRTPEFAANYAAGLRSFVNEAKILARFDHPAVVKVHRFWEAQGTAYMVMPFVHGPTLRDVRRSMRLAPTEAWLRGVLDPLLDALAMLHAEGIYHRDIAPDNILLPSALEPVLLDFGAARRVIGDRTQTLTAVLKPSYAPIEQYAEATQVRQGPWTDLYALGAVVHYMLLATPPPPSTVRSMHDEMRLLTAHPPAGVSVNFLATIQWCLAVRPQDRPQCVQQLRMALDGRLVPPAPRVRPVPVVDDDEVDAAPPHGRVTAPMDPGAAWADELDAIEREGATRSRPASATWDTTIRLASAPSPTVPLPKPVPGWIQLLQSRRGTALVAASAFAIAGAGMLQMMRDTRQQPPASTWRALAQQAPATEPMIRTQAPPPPARAETPLKAVATVATRPEQVPLLQTLAANEELVVESTPPAPVAMLAQAPPVVRAAHVRPAEKRSQAAKKRPPKPAAARPQRLSPTEACSDRGFFTRPFCVHRKCEEPAFRQHPQCVALREQREERLARGPS